VPVVDALFIGRADLTISLGAGTADDRIVVDAVERICAAGMAAKRRAGMLLARSEDVGLWHAKGASLFILASDHDFCCAGLSLLRRPSTTRAEAVTLP